MKHFSRLNYLADSQKRTRWLLTIFSWILVVSSSQAQGFIQQTGASNPYNNITGSDAGFGRQPTLVDIDGDGDLDLFTVGANGDIYFYRNTGTKTAPVYTSAASPTGLPAYGTQFYLSFQFGDLDGDGDLDAVTGNADGAILSYRNTGSKTNPSFTQLTGAANPFAGFKFGQYTSVSLGDFDGDGDLDLLSIGDQVHYLRNTGSPTAPAYTDVTGAGNPFTGVVQSNGLYIPTVGDVDGDGDLDLAVANYQTIDYYQNSGTKTSPAYIQLTGGANPFNGFSVLYPLPNFGDVDGDGDPDAVLGLYTNPKETQPLIYLKNVLRLPQQPTPPSANVCAGATVTTSVRANSDGAVTYQWYRNGQNTSTPVAGKTSATLTLTNVQPGDAGTYYALATGGGGTLFSTAFTLTVSGVAITQQPTSSSTVCVGTNVTTFVNTSGTVSGFQWYRNGGVVSGQTSATLNLTNVQSTQAGNYVVVVTGCNSVTSTPFNLMVNTPPTVNLINNGPLTCAQTSVTLTASGTNGSTYAFRDANGPIASSGNTASVSNMGTYTVTASLNGCTSTTTTTVSSNTVAPTVSITPSSTAICAGQSVTLTANAATSGGTLSYRWNTPTPPATTSAVSVSTTGTYSVTVTRSDNGCVATANSSVTVNPLPTVSLSNNGPLTCAQTSVTLTASGTNGSTYAFRGASGPIASSGNTASVSNMGTYTLTASLNGCTSTTTTTVSSNTVAPTVSITPSSTAICAGQSVTLNANASTSGGTLSYRWNTPTPPATTSAISVSTTGTYSVTVTRSDNGCFATANASVTVNPLPTPSIVGLASAYCQDAGSQPLNGNPSGGIFTVDGSPATSFNPASLTVGQHTVVYSYTNSNGCSNTTSQSVTVKEVPTPPTLLTQSGHPYPGGVSSLTITQNVGNVILTVAGCTGGTITWAGGNATTLAVSTGNQGTQTFTATCTRNGCISPAATATVTVVPTTLSVLYRDADYGNTTNQIIQPFLELTNVGNDAIPYNQITVRYWFTSEGAAPPTDLTVYYAQLGAVQMNYVTLPQPRQGALGYVEYSFPDGGSLGAGANSGPIENGIQKTDRSNFNEADDYSYQANYADYLPNAHITAYRNGVIFWGQEPDAVTSQTAIKAYTSAKDEPTTSQIQTRVELRNEGNAPVAVASLKLRYYFTSDNGQLASAYVDYADIGAQNVQATVVKLSTPVNGADSYVELSFPASSLTLAPLTSLGAIDFRIVRSDYGLFDQTNDYSYVPTYGTVAPNTHITVYLDGNLVFGTAPTGAARVAASEPGVGLAVRLLGNPVRGNEVKLEVRGAEGQPLRLVLSDPQGRQLSEQSVPAAESIERRTLTVGSQAAGLLLLQVSTPTQRQVVKVIKTE